MSSQGVSQRGIAVSSQGVSTEVHYEFARGEPKRDSCE
jgi:hypothetical protein